MIKKPYKYNVGEVRERKDIDLLVSLVVEGYAFACADLMTRLSGDSPCGKSYDPLVISGSTAHSYAFELKDGGRHHDLTLFKNVGEIMDCLADEAVAWIKADPES